MRAQSVAGPSPACEQQQPSLRPPRQPFAPLPRLRKREARRAALQLCAFFWQKPAQDPSPPRPDARFTRSDLVRIKTQGPTLEDVTAHVHVEYDTRKGEHIVKEHAFVPPNVLGDAYTNPDPEPQWSKLPEMPLMQFHHGLRQRNWTSPYYDSAAPRWHVQFWKDDGRFMRPSFPGYRALVTKEDGSKAFVQLPAPGLPTFVQDHISGGTVGSVHKPTRIARAPTSPAEVGYNQVFQEIYEAHQERLPRKALESWAGNPSRTLPRSKLKRYDNPADAHLSVEWKSTPPETSLRGFVNLIPGALTYFFTTTFVLFVVVFSIFRNQKKAPSDLQEALEFAQSKAKARKDGTTEVTLADVAGLDAIKVQFEEIVSFLKNPDQFSATGVKPPKGVLLEGPPGTGKTLIAKAIAGEAEVGFYQMAGSEFVEAIVGVGAARVRDLFKRARAYDSPCIIFVDEIDALGIKRAEGGMKTNEEREQTLNQLLTEMDGFNPSSGVVFIAATNRADLLDPALMRAGRFDRKIAVPRPDAAARYDILKVHAKKHAIADDVDLQQLAKDLPGLVGADLANVLNEAALAAVRGGADAIHERHVWAAKDRVLQGVRKPMLSTSTELGSRIMRSFAAHESGRALLAVDLRARTGLADPVEKVTILRRGNDLTRTVFLRRADEDYLILTRKQLLARIQLQLAGHAAEEVLGLDISTYSARDFVKAQELAERMVQNYGMSDLGVTTYASPTFVTTAYKEGKEDVPELFQRQMLVRGSTPGLFQPASDMIQKLETEQNTIVEGAYREVVGRLRALRPVLQSLTDELNEKKEVDGSDIEKMYHDFQGAAK